MMQIIHDAAPRAQLMSHTAGVDGTTIAAAINKLRNEGADIIVDDVLASGEPMWMDGVATQAVDAAVAAGVAYFSAAGNAGRESFCGR